MSELVTIIMPIYNAERFLQRAIESVLKQKYTNYELLLINDGSTDNSFYVCKKYINNQRIRYYENDNHGVSYSRNFGLKHAKGKYLMFIDADDCYHEQMVDEMVKTIEKERSDLVCCGYYQMDFQDSCIVSHRLNTINSIGEGLANSISQMKKNACFNVLWNKIFRSEIVLKHNINMDENLWMGEDFLFVIQYLYFVNKITLIDYVGYYYYINDNSLQKRQRENELEERLEQEVKLEEFYDSKGLPINQVYEEYLKISYSYLERCVRGHNNYKEGFMQVVKNQRISKALQNVNTNSIYIRLYILMVKLKLRDILYLMLMMTAYKKLKKQEDD